MKHLTPNQITELLYRVCHCDQPIKAVAVDLGVSRSVIQKWVRRYEGRAAA